MIKEIYSFDLYEDFIKGFSGASVFADPHFEFDNVNLYNSLRKHYNYLAKSAAKSFEECYDSYKGCSDIEAKAKSDFKKSISIIIEDIKNTYISLGQYDFDSETIYNLIT